VRSLCHARYVGSLPYEVEDGAVHAFFGGTSIQRAWTLRCKIPVEYAVVNNQMPCKRNGSIYRADKAANVAWLSSVCTPCCMVCVCRMLHTTLALLGDAKVVEVKLIRFPDSGKPKHCFGE
jgi:hypothetical protein